MDAKVEELSQRVRTARAARLRAQRMRLLAAKRAEKLERELTSAAESGVKVEISRALEARGRHQASIRRRSVARYLGVAAFGLLVGIVVLGAGRERMHEAAVPPQIESQAPVLQAAPGDRLRLAYSYSVSPPAR